MVVTSLDTCVRSADEYTPGSDAMPLVLDQRSFLLRLSDGDLRRDQAGGNQDGGEHAEPDELAGDVGESGSLEEGAPDHLERPAHGEPVGDPGDRRGEEP